MIEVNLVSLKVLEGITSLEDSEEPEHAVVAFLCSFVAFVTFLCCVFCLFFTKTPLIFFRNNLERVSDVQLITHHFVLILSPLSKFLYF